MLRVKELLQLFVLLNGCRANKNKKQYLLQIQVREGKANSQFEEKCQSVADKLKEHLGAKFKLIKNSCRRGSVDDLGFFSVWGGVIFINLSLGYEQNVEYRQKLAHRLLRFAESNDYTLTIKERSVHLIF